MDVHPEPSPEALSVGGYRLGWMCCTVRQIPQSYQAMRMKTPNPRKALKTIRSLGTFWVAEKTLDHLEAIRRYELDIALQLLPLTGKLLEIGAGTGWQAQELEDRGYDVSAIDLPSSKYRENRIRTITDYDGKEIPFEDNVFDVVFSSNVFEHIPHIDKFQKEIRRVLKPDGYALIILPSSSWRLWTNITHLLKYWTIPPTHGEHAENAFMEIYYFSRRWWSRLFHETDWIVVTQDSNRLFYTGSSIADSRLQMSTRRTLSRVLGSSCHIFVLRRKNHA